MRPAIGMTIVIALAVLPAAAETKVYPADSLIIPMDTTYQDHGMLEAYGLVYDLLLAGVPVDWTIEPGKEYGEEDFVASAVDVATEDPVTAHGYRGGPFVIDGALYDDASTVFELAGVGLVVLDDGVVADLLDRLGDLFDRRLLDRGVERHPPPFRAR